VFDVRKRRVDGVDCLMMGSVTSARHTCATDEWNGCSVIVSAVLYSCIMPQRSVNCADVDKHGTESVHTKSAGDVAVGHGKSEDRGRHMVRTVINVSVVKLHIFIVV